MSVTQKCIAEFELDQKEEMIVALEIHIGNLQRFIRQGYETPAFSTKDYKQFLSVAQKALVALNAARPLLVTSHE